MISVAIVITAMLVGPVQPAGGGALSPTPPERTGEDSALAAAMAAAVEAYEGSIAQVFWHQREYQPPCAARARKEWVLFQESDRYVDATTGAWFHWARTVQALPPDYERTTEEALFFGDGSQRVTWSPKSNRGMLTQTDWFFSGGPNLWRVMGRCTEYADPMRSPPLAEQLRRARELRWLAPTENEPWPGVRGLGAVSRGTIDLDVRLDPEHGLAPRLIRTVRAADQWVVEVIYVMRYERVGGLSIPAVAVHHVTSREKVEDVERPFSEERAADFERALDMEGLPEGIRGDELRRWLARLQRPAVIDPTEGIVAVPIGTTQPGSPVPTPGIMVADGFRLNQPMSLDEMFARISPDASMFNGLTGERTTVEAIRAVFEALKRGEE